MIDTANDNSGHDNNQYDEDDKDDYNNFENCDSQIG